MKIANQIALWADKLRDISASGLTFCSDTYDLENYQKIQDISIEMFAFSTNQHINKIKPLCSSIISRPTPFSVADAAIINNNGELLLIQKKHNRLWALPGGLLNVGETPANGAIREAFEEAGIRSRPVKIIGIYDSRLCGTESAFHMYTTVFLCEPLGSSFVIDNFSANREVSNIGWFDKISLPKQLEPSHKMRIGHSFLSCSPDYKPYFDHHEND